MAVRKKPWLDELKSVLPTLGHRNWIAIVDGAFPLQVGAIQMIVSQESLDDVLIATLRAIESSPHVRPTALTDFELDFMGDSVEANAVRTSIYDALKPYPHQRLPHDQIIEQISEAAEQFQVLIIKSSTCIPYTSVFLRLDCGYWSDEEEAALRHKMWPGKSEE